MPLYEKVSNGLRHRGNESLYPLIELMSELGWNVFEQVQNHRIHLDWINKLENTFRILYNLKTPSFNNELLESLKRLNIHSKDTHAIDIGSYLILDEMGSMKAFSERVNNLLLAPLPGLRLTLEIYTDIYYQWRIHEQHQAGFWDGFAGIEDIKNDFSTHKVEEQFRGFLSDKVYQQVLDNELYNEGQRDWLAKIITEKFKQKFIKGVIERLHCYALGPYDWDALIGYLYQLVENIDSPNKLEEIVDKIADLPIVKENRELRGFLGKKLAIADSYEFYSQILELQDSGHRLSEFKPEIGRKIQNQIESQVLHCLKSYFSSIIYKSDSLTEEYLPVSGRGLRNTESALDQKISNYFQILNKCHYKEDILAHIIEAYRSRNPSSGLPTYNGNEVLYRHGSDNFKKIFHNDDFSLHQLIIFTTLSKHIDIGIYEAGIFRKNLEDGVIQLCVDFFNYVSGDALYCIISNITGKSINLDDLFIRDPNHQIISIDSKKLKEALPNQDNILKLLCTILLHRAHKTYYDIEKEAYEFHDIHTKQSMLRDSNYYSFDEDDGIHKLFRNHVETRQHDVNNTNFEAQGLQVGDTHFSNVSLTIIPDIAISYAVKANSASDTNCYSWIIIQNTSTGVNTTRYMENNAFRSPAQEFIVPDKMPNKQLGAVKIEQIDKKAGEGPSKLRIVDGFLSSEIYLLIKEDKLHKLRGLEQKYKFFLEAAYLYHIKALDGDLKDDATMKQLEFDAHLNATEFKVTRTNFQNLFAKQTLPSIDKSGDGYLTYSLKDLTAYHKALHNSLTCKIKNFVGYYNTVSQKQKQSKIDHEKWQDNPSWHANYGDTPGNIKFKAKEKIHEELSDSELFNYLVKFLLSGSVSFRSNMELHKNNIEYALKRLKDSPNGLIPLIDFINKEGNDASFSSYGCMIIFKILDQLDSSFIEQINPNLKKIRQTYTTYPYNPSFPRPVTDRFLDNFIQTFEFIDTADLLKSMVNSTPNPWRLYQRDQSYDGHLVDWIATKKNSTSDFFQLYPSLIGTSSGHLNGITRGYPITAGGSYDIQGKALPSETPTWKSVCTQYWPISLSGLELLKANIFITILEEKEISNTATCATHVCRYRYPDLRDVNKKSMQKYLENVSPQLFTQIEAILDEDVTDIVNALGWQIDTSHPVLLKNLSNDFFVKLIAGPREYKELCEEGQASFQIQQNLIENVLQRLPKYQQLLENFHLLNAKFLQEIAINILKDETLNETKRYQLLVSLHPLQDLNGRCTRMWHSLKTGTPLYLFNWDLDIVIDESAFNESYSIYQRMINQLKNEFFRAKEQKQFPRYYENNEFRLAALGIDPQLYTSTEIKKLSEAIQNVLKNPSTQQAIGQKDYYSFSKSLMDALYALPEFKILSQVDANKNTALHSACINKINIAQLIKNVDTQDLGMENLINSYGQTPMHVALINANVDAFVLLFNTHPYLLLTQDLCGKKAIDYLLIHLSSYKISEVNAFVSFCIDKHIDLTIYRNNSDESLTDILIKKDLIDIYTQIIKRIPDFPTNKSLVQNRDNQTVTYREDSDDLFDVPDIEENKLASGEHVTLPSNSKIINRNSFWQEEKTEAIQPLPHITVKPTPSS